MNGPHSESSGEKIGDYRIGAELGRDAASRRYRALDAEGRSVVLRLFDGMPDLGDHDLAALKTDLDLAGTLNEPGLLDLIDAGRAGELVYLAEHEPIGPSFETSLLEIESSGEPEIESRIEILRRLADAARILDRAHEAGLVHGRLTPAAIQLGATGPAITGLGIRALEGGRRSGASLFDLAYRAPEQLGESALRTERRADVWALGAIMHRIVTGEPPIPAPSEAELRREAARFVPRTMRSASRGLPAGLDAIAAAALAPERRRRYERASVLADDIERVLAGGTALAQRPGLGDRFLRWMRREPGIAAGGFVLFAFLGTAGVVTGWFVGVGDRDAAVGPLEARISRETALRASEARARRELEKDRALAAALEEIAALIDVLRCGRFGPVGHDRLLDLYLRAYRKRGIELEARLDSDASAEILDGAHARSARDARRLMSGLYGIDLILAASAAEPDFDPDGEEGRRLRAIDRNVTIMVERCEKDRSFRHLWRVARHGDQTAVDRFDAFLDPGHWRRQSPDYLIFLAAQLARRSERAEAAFQLVEEAVAHHADSHALQVLRASLLLRRALARSPIDSAALRRALSHLEIATALQPRSAPVRMLLALAQAQDADYRSALLNVDEATRLENESALIWLMRARFFEQSPMTDRAREAAERALELDPGLEQARELLLALHERR